MHQPDESEALLAYAAEQWLCSEYPELEHNTDKYGGWDATLPTIRGPVLFGIKHTPRRQGRLLRRAHEKIWCAYYCLVVGDDPSVFRFGGYTAGVILNSPANWVTDVPRPCWGLRQTQLQQDLGKLIRDLQQPQQDELWGETG